MPCILSTKLCRGSDETVGGTSIILFIFGIDPNDAIHLCMVCVWVYVFCMLYVCILLIYVYVFNVCR